MADSGRVAPKAAVSRARFCRSSWMDRFPSAAFTPRYFATASANVTDDVGARARLRHRHLPPENGRRHRVLRVLP